MVSARLAKQIQDHLPADVARDPRWQPFLASVAETYQAYEATGRERAESLQDCEDRFALLSEEELRRNGNFLRTAMSNMNSGIAIEDDNRKVLFVNHRFCNLMKMDVSPESVIGADANDYANLKQELFADPESYLRVMHEVLERRVPVNKQRLEMADGTLLDWSYLPIEIGGRSKGHFWEFEDVTQQVRDQKRLAEGLERSRLIMRASLDAVIVADHERHIEYWNPRAEELFGWTVEEATGKRMNELLHPSHVSDILRQQEIEYPTDDLSPILNQVLELTAVTKQGREFPVEMIVVPYQHSGKTYYCKFVKDISFRREADKRLMAQETKYRSIIANMNLGLVEVDLNRIVVSANQGFYRMSGYTAEEVIGDTVDKFMPTQQELNLINAKLDSRLSGTSDYYEIPVLNKSGERRWWLVSATPVTNDTGEVTGSIGIQLDITDQKRLEHDLAIAKTNAEQASIAKEAFLANMSHEIRTPLNAIIGMIRELGREQLTETQQSYLSHTDTAARHLLSIVNSILDLSKIEAGELELDTHDFSLEALVDNIESILCGKASAKRLEMHCSIDPKIWPAYYGDSARLRQVLLNLLDNAVKFTSRGSVRLYLKVMDETETRQSLRISIVDTGIGMAPEYLDQIFTKFSQAERSISRRFGGTGLGMPITQEILRLMGGTISVTSKKKHGTQFVIDLDLAKGDVERILTPAPTNDHQLSGARLLLVEDNAMNRFIARKTLAHFGCTVDEAENGRVALERLREGTYDLVLMDIQMPVLDGIETTKIIRNELNLRVPIVALTANAFKQDIDGYLDSGMNDYVTKPFEETRLFEAIARLLPGFSPAVATATVDDGYDLSSLRELSRGDQSFVTAMIELFVEHTPVTLCELAAALTARDYPTLARAAHRIKPSIENMGIHQIAGLAKEIELAAKTQPVDHGGLAERVERLTTTLERVIERLRVEHA
ncbi:PAS domain-containing hybrid sensor histidine kinase/response regulator [Lewinella sp. IMCC34183]|uniref:PAS domain-containing hybrid sensor histidine kinase/response regulator n=1 Tax=Lewinella sp. IMCC34183 TaxID=2248762 RepID=UPI000E2495C8|nr:PAS domain-containing hybrid sensor histidine kinase/response regulator [Lewinella sp. IMCC34183]